MTFGIDPMLEVLMKLIRWLFIVATAALLAAALVKPHAAISIVAPAIQATVGAMKDAAMIAYATATEVHHVLAASDRRYAQRLVIIALVAGLALFRLAAWVLEQWSSIRRFLSDVHTYARSIAEIWEWLMLLALILLFIFTDQVLV